MKRILFIIFAIFLTNLPVFSADYDRFDTRKTVKSTNGYECRRVRKRFAKPLTRYAQPRPAQKAGYYKTGMNIRYQKPIKNTPTITPSRFDKNYTISQAQRTTCNGITYYGSKNICK